MDAVQPQRIVTVKPYKKWPWVLGILLALVVGWSFGALMSAAAGTGSTSTPAADFAPTVSAEAPAGLPPGSFSDGKFEIGSEIPRGTYKTLGPPEDSLTKTCTWTKYTTADTDAPPSNGELVQGQSTVTLSSKGYIVFNGGCVWSAN